MTNKTYQHILIFGRQGHFILRVDDDASTEKVFRDYDDALFAAIAFLASSRMNEGG